MNRISKYFYFASFAVLAVTQSAFAAERQSLGLAERVSNFYSWALGMGGILALGILIYAGILYTSSAGNASRISEAKKWIWAAAIGLIVLFGSYVFLNTINPNLTTLDNLDFAKRKELGYGLIAKDSPEFGSQDNPLVSTPIDTIGDGGAASTVDVGETAPDNQQKAIASGGASAYFAYIDKLLVLLPGEDYAKLDTVYYGSVAYNLDQKMTKLSIFRNTEATIYEGQNFDTSNKKRWMTIRTDSDGKPIYCKKYVTEDKNGKKGIVDCLTIVKKISEGTIDHTKIDLTKVCWNEDNPTNGKCYGDWFGDNYWASAKSGWGMTRSIRVREHFEGSAGIPLR